MKIAIAILVTTFALSSVNAQAAGQSDCNAIGAWVDQLSEDLGYDSAYVDEGMKQILTFNQELIELKKNITQIGRAVEILNRNQEKPSLILSSEKIAEISLETQIKAESTSEKIQNLEIEIGQAKAQLQERSFCDGSEIAWIIETYETQIGLAHVLASDLDQKQEMLDRYELNAASKVQTLQK